jgi:dihydrofolate reductase
MKINLIWAEARDLSGNWRAIGNDGKIPWFLPEDLQHFKQTTGSDPLIMGRKTYESLPVRPLKNRTNIVISSKNGTSFSSEKDFELLKEKIAAGENPIWVADTKEAVKVAEMLGKEVVWVIGGQSVYESFLPLGSKAVVTRVNIQVEADTFAPKLTKNWIEETHGEQIVAENGTEYQISEFINAEFKNEKNKEE